MYPNDMPQNPRRILLAESVVSSLKERIGNGTWATTLPGIQSLAKELGVSRKPIEQALTILEKQEWIGAAEAGRRRKILKTAEGGSRRFRIGLLHPEYQELSNLLRESLDTARSELGRYDVDVFPFIHTPVDHPDKIRLPEEAITSAKLDAVVSLSLPASAIRKVHPAPLPILQLGGERDGSKGVSRLFLDITTTARSAFRAFFAQGKTRISFVEWRFQTPLRKKLREGIAAEFESAGLAFLPDFHAPNVSPNGIDWHLEKLQTKFNPQVIIALSPERWMRVISHPKVRRSDTAVYSLIATSGYFTEFEKKPALLRIGMDETTDTVGEWLDAVLAGNPPEFDRHFERSFLID